MPRRTEWPAVGVVIATRGNRPHLLRRALASVSEQDYPGPVRIVIVFDGVAPDWRLARGGDRPVLVHENWRTSGLAGARNTGILAAGDCELVALCDDDDVWAPAKLTTQVSALRATPGALFGTCAVEVEYNGRRRPRLLGVREIGLQHLTRVRTRALRPSGFVARQAALVRDPCRGGIGLLAENGPPASTGWDLLVRAVRRAPIVHVDTPLVRELWRRVEVDPRTCHGQLHALRWILTHHPDIAGDRAAAARLHAEIACWEAAAGDHAAAWASARATVAARWWSPRGLLAIAAAGGLVRGRWLHAVLHHLVD